MGIIINLIRIPIKQAVFHGIRKGPRVFWGRGSHVPSLDLQVQFQRCADCVVLNADTVASFGPLTVTVVNEGLGWDSLLNM